MSCIYVLFLALVSLHETIEVKFTAPASIQQTIEEHRGLSGVGIENEDGPRTQNRSQ